MCIRRGIPEGFGPKVQEPGYSRTGDGQGHVIDIPLALSKTTRVQTCLIFLLSIGVFFICLTAYHLEIGFPEFPQKTFSVLKPESDNLHIDIYFFVC